MGARCAAVVVVALLIGVCVACDEAPTSPSPAPTPAPQPTPTPAPPPAPGALFTLAGRVTAAPLNEPVGGVLVEAMHGGRVIQSATTSATGEYQVNGLPPDEYVIRMTRSGYNTRNRDVVISADTRRDYVMERNRVAIFGVATQTACTAPIEGVRVEILDGPDAGKSAVTDRAGFQYRIDDVAWGTVRLRASKAGFGSVDTTLTISPPVAVGGAMTRQDFALQEQTGHFTFTGRVADRMVETAGGITGALVLISGGPNAGISTTTVGGNYQFRELRAGRMDLEVSKPGFYTERFPNVPVCSNVGAWDVWLTPVDATLRGVVYASDSSRLAGATVEIVAGPPAGKSAVTNANGEYAIVGIYGTFTARASKAGFVARQTTMTTGPYLAPNFILERAP